MAEVHNVFVSGLKERVFGVKMPLFTFTNYHSKNTGPRIMKQSQSQFVHCPTKSDKN